MGRSEWWITTLDGAPPLVNRWPEKSSIAMACCRRPGTMISFPSLWLEREDQVVFSARLGDTTDLWSLRLSPATGKVTGVPRRLTVGTGLHRYPSFAATRSTRKGRSLGVIALASLNDNIDVWSLPLDADRGVVRGEMTRLTHDAAPDTNVSASRDGERAVFVSTRSGGPHIWMKDLRSGARDATYGGRCGQIVSDISADGNQVAYATREGEKWSVDAVSLDARGRNGAERRLCEGCGMTHELVARRQAAPLRRFPQRRIGLLDFAAGFRGDVVSHPKHSLWQGEFSPDDRWVAFMAVRRIDRPSSMSCRRIHFAIRLRPRHGLRSRTAKRGTTNHAGRPTATCCISSPSAMDFAVSGRSGSTRGRSAPPVRRSRSNIFTAAGCR